MSNTELLIKPDASIQIKDTFILKRRRQKQMLSFKLKGTQGIQNNEAIIHFYKR